MNLLSRAQTIKDARIVLRTAVYEQEQAVLKEASPARLKELALAVAARQEVLRAALLELRAECEVDHEQQAVFPLPHVRRHGAGDPWQDRL